MKKILKTLMSLSLALALVLALAACNGGAQQSENPSTNPSQPAGNEESQEPTVPSVFPAETLKIGVELYDLSDDETINLMDYFAELSEHLNLEFKYSEAISTADEEMAFIDDCYINECDIFIGKYNVTGAQQVQTVIDYGMYYVGQTDDEAIYNEFCSNPLYVGGISQGDTDYLSGKAMGDWCVENGFTKVIYSNGGADFGVQMFIDRQRGFMDAIGDSAEVIVVSGFPGDQFFADQSAALSTEGVQAVCSSIPATSFWVQPIASAGLQGTVKVATMGSVSQSVVESFRNGQIDMMSIGGSDQRYGLGIAFAINAIDGYGNAALSTDGNASKDASNIWSITSTEVAEKLYDKVSGERVFSYEDILSLCLSYNADANHDTLAQVLAKSEMDNLLK